MAKKCTRPIEVYPDGTAIIHLTQNQHAIVDAKDVPLVYDRCWRLCPNGEGNFYAAARGRDRKATVRLHRVIMGALPEQLVDHINGDGLDNRRANLRIATNSQNQSNRQKMPTNNTSGFVGVDQLPSGNWRARLNLKPKPKSLGSFPTAEEAARAYDRAALEYFGEFATLNFPDGQ